MKKYILGAAILLTALSPAFAQAQVQTASGLTSAQISALIGLLQAFGADQSIINNVQAALSGVAQTTGGVSSATQTKTTFNSTLSPICVAGDMNGDGLITQADVDYVKSISGTSAGVAGYDAKADLDKSGAVTATDILKEKGFLVTCGLTVTNVTTVTTNTPIYAPTCADADTNSDGTINTTDLTYVNSKLTSCNPTSSTCPSNPGGPVWDARADLDKSGVVTLTDKVLENNLVSACQTTTSAPTITSLSPTSGPVGTTVMINGTGFDQSTAVYFNGASVTAASNTSFPGSMPTSFSFTVPSFSAGSCSSGYCATTVAPGTYGVQVSNANGTSNTATFTVTGVTTTYTPTCADADVNGDHVINSSDTKYVNDRLTSTPTNPTTWGWDARADLNKSGSITVADVGLETNLVSACAPTTTTAPTLVSVVSRKTHGNAGTFDLPIDISQPISGAVTVEPRAVGSGHTLVFTFSGPITSMGTVTAVDSSGSAIQVNQSITAGNSVSITLGTISNNKRVTVTIPNINGSGANASVSLGFLVGDVDNSRTVDQSDYSAVNAQLAQYVTSSNFKDDVNVSGTLSVADLATVNANMGLTLP